MIKRKKSDIIVGIVGTIAAIFVANASLCCWQVDAIKNERLASPAYHGYIQTLEDINHYNKVLDEDSVFLSDKGKKYFEKRAQDLTTQKQKLEDNLKEYDESINKWTERKNPLKYFH